MRRSRAGWADHAPVTASVLLRSEPTRLRDSATPGLPSLRGPVRDPQLLQRFGLDLADALAGQRQVAANLLEGEIAALLNAGLLRERDGVSCVENAHLSTVYSYHTHFADSNPFVHPRARFPASSSAFVWTTQSS